VREHEELVLISREGMVQRISAEGINRYGRASQGVKVMNIREDDVVSAVARVVDSGGDTAAGVAEDADEVLGDDVTGHAPGSNGEGPADDSAVDPEVDSEVEE